MNLGPAAREPGGREPGRAGPSTPGPTEPGPAGQGPAGFWSGPLPAVVVLVLGLVLALQDGLRPYRIAWRKLRWVPVQAVPAKIEVPYVRQEVYGGTTATDPDLAEGKPSRLKAEELARDRNRRWKARQASRDRPGGRTRTVLRKVEPRHIVSRVVERGLLFRFEERRYFVRLTYAYVYKGKVYRRWKDEAPLSFRTHDEAKAYLRKRAGRWPITVWVNPSDPRQATAFLDYRGWLSVRLGLGLAFGGLVWLLVLLAFRRRAGPDGEAGAPGAPAELNGPWAKPGA